MTAARSASAIALCAGLTFLAIAYLGEWAGWMAWVLPAGLPDAADRAREPFALAGILLAIGGSVGLLAAAGRAGERQEPPPRDLKDPEPLPPCSLPTYSDELDAERGRLMRL